MLIRWAWSFVWGTKPPKSPRRNGTASMSSRNRVLIIVEYSPSCSWMECCYSSFSLRQEFFIRLGQSIVFGRPGWRSCGNVKKSAQQICLGAWLQTNKSIAEPTRESYVCSHSSTRPTATFAIVFTGHCSYFVYTFPPAQKHFVSILHSYAEKKQSYLKCNGGSDDTRHIPLLGES